MTTSFKIYLIDNLVRGNEPAASEVRRFDLPITANYINLCHKIEILIPTLQGKTYSLYWKDNQGEFISFSSDEEFNIARREMTISNELKVIYALTAQSKTANGDPQGGQALTHTGVSCDGCNVTPIVGYRYKCTFCPDYDLCGNCEMRGVHDEHVMIRFNKPIPSVSLLGRKVRLLNRSTSRLLTSLYERDSTSSETDEDMEALNAMSSKKRHHSKGHEHKYEKKSHRHGHRHDHEKRRRCYESFRNMAGSAHATAIPTLAQRLGGQTIGQLLSYLDPLGMSTNQSQCPAAAAFAGATTSATSTTPQCSKNGNPAPAPAATVRFNTEAGASASSASAATPSSSANGATPTDKPREERSDSLANLIQTAMPNLAMAIHEITQNLAQQHVDSGNDDWAVINAEDKDESPQQDSSASAPAEPSVAAPSNAPTQADGSIYPDLTPPTAPRHSNPNIQRGIETLLSMGFRNNSDFLTTLLEVYDGDIHKALDVLQDHK